MYLLEGFLIFEIGSMVPLNESFKVNSSLENFTNTQFPPNNCTDMTWFFWQTCSIVNGLSLTILKSGNIAIIMQLIG